MKKLSFMFALAVGATALALPSTSLASSSAPLRPATDQAAGQQGSAALPRIEVDGSRFADSESGETFVPRGANYVKLSPTSGQGDHFHSTFEPGLYDADGASAALAAMARDGYNVVRVFIDPGSTDAAAAHGIGRGRGSTGPVNGAYMDNVADFVTRAAEHGVYVMPSMDAFPQNDHYFNIIEQHPDNPPAEAFGGDNLNYLHPGVVAAKAEYLKQFAAALQDRVGDLTTTILAYGANNELFFEGNHAPFDDWSGTVTGLDGETYDMASADQRQKLADTSLVEYSRRLKEALASVDGDALLTIGFFTNQAVGKAGFDGFQMPPGATDNRFPGRPSALSQAGTVDFIDMHVYPSSPTYDLAADLGSSEHQLIEQPYIIGEFGARKDVYPDVQQAAVGMRDLQVASCELGATGWLFWTWDTSTELANQSLFYNLVEGNGAINSQLASAVRSDACRLDAVPPPSTTTTTAPPTSSTSSTTPDSGVPSSSTSTSSARQVADRGGDLPDTGSNSTLMLVAIGAALVAAGVALTLAVRKYRRLRPVD